MREITIQLEIFNYFNDKVDATKIFHNEWYSVYVVTFLKHLVQEADDYILQILAYLNYLQGNEILFMPFHSGVSLAQ